MSEWKTIESAPEGLLIETKTDDAHGIRNEQRLTKRGRMFWTEDGGMYVYYTPTHWRPVSDDVRVRWAGKLGHASESSHD
jgi:hypothetical protein